MKKRIVALLMVSILSVSVLTGCKKSAEKEPETTAVAQATESAEEATASSQTTESAEETTTESPTESTSVKSEEVSEASFIEDVTAAIEDQIGQGESYKDVTFENGDLCVSVDFSNVDPSPFTLEDLAITRVSSITDAILELNQYDDLWNTITVDFGNVGKVTNSKEDIVNSEYGRYFSSEKFVLVK